MNSITSKTSPRTRSVLASVGLCVAIAAATHSGLLRAETSADLAPVVRPYYTTDEDTRLARAAWRYFEINRLPSGLVASAASFPATTMWDVGSQLAGMISAVELGYLSLGQFHLWIGQVLASLEALPLCKGELPNKAYNAEKLIPTGYGEVNAYKEIGFSALDLGRLALWLDILTARYPNHAAAAARVTGRWHLARLARDGYLMGTELSKTGEAWNQEGRLGYEQYAAYGLAKLGVSAGRASNVWANAHEVEVDGVTVFVDGRKEAHNYVTSEPYVLDGLESGFRAIPPAFGARVLAAQIRRTHRTGLLTAWSEDNLDGPPWFVYNTVYVDGKPWASLSSSGADASAFRGSSLKAAYGWHLLFRTGDTARTYQGLRWLIDPQRGAFAGFYEETGEPNRALTLNTNGIILEEALYARIGYAIETWAHGVR